MYADYVSALAGLERIRSDYVDAQEAAERKHRLAEEEASRLIPSAQAAVEKAEREVEDALADGRRALALVDEEDLLPKKTRPSACRQSLGATKAALASALDRLEFDVQQLADAKAAQLEADRAERERERNRRAEEARRAAEAEAAAARAAAFQRTLVACGVIALIVLIAAVAIL